MKNLAYFTLIFFSFLGMTLNVNAQDLSDIAKLKMPDHPRILWFEEDINPLVQEVSKEAQWQKIHQAILSESDKMLSLPTLERIQIGKRLLDKSRECLKRVFYLSYSYNVTRYPKYLERAEKELLKVSNFTDWNPSHFLDVAEMTMAVSI